MPGATITRGTLPAYAERTSRQLFPLLCLAPHGVFRAISLTRKSGGLLPRLFTLTQCHQLLSPKASGQSDFSAGSLGKFRFCHYLAADTIHRQLMAPGGLFSVTLSVTRDSHPEYPRFHEACRLPVFGLSSDENDFQPAIACHVAENNIARPRDPPGRGN